MSVDDVRGLRVEAELADDLVTVFFLLDKVIIIILALLPDLAVTQEVALKCRHLFFAVDRRIFIGPDKPHDILPVTALLRVICQVIPLARVIFKKIIERLAAVVPALQPHTSETPVLIERNTAMVIEIIIISQIQAARLEQKLDVLLQFLTVDERAREPVHDVLLGLAQPVRVIRVDRRKKAIQHRIGLVIDRDHLLVIVNLVEQQAVIHVKLWPPHDELPLQLELDHGDRLVHALFQHNINLADLVSVMVDREELAVVIRVGAHRQIRQRNQIDAVIILQRVEIAVLRADADHIGDARRVAGGRTHPQDIVIAPLDVHRVIIHQAVHDGGRSRSSVKDVAHDVQVIDDQPLNQLAQGDDKIFRPVNANNRGNDFIIIVFLIGKIDALIDQFLDDVGEIFRQRLAHLGTGVF